MATIMTRHEERPDSMPSLEDTPVNPTNDAAENQIKGDQRGDTEGTGDSEWNLNPRPTGLRTSEGV
ncbi:hypothetical protein L484_016262 [Morus notabilis]|uniref:Uncharacterized protein n=1 Tax=Morus notabilis TaxID=981085 RepID=W9QSH8_9ROSA|nr:hypothetical protein L484_016262 [Morus notabilis]